MSLHKVYKIREDAQKRAKQRDETKNELASHAIVALSELGYARTGLRDIAALSGRSVGALSYHFKDKADLIAYCVRLYKQQFISQIDKAMNVTGGQDVIMRAVTTVFSRALEHDAGTHRLWYDIRSQALFEEAFHPVVEEIEDSLMAMVCRLLNEMGKSSDNVRDTYFVLDGLFRTHLHATLKGDAGAPARLQSAMEAVLGALSAAVQEPSVREHS